MKLVWAGPWNERSAVATFGLNIVDELSLRGHEVDVLRTETSQDLDLPPLRAPGRIEAAQDCELGSLLRDVDGILVNLGDHYGYHGGALPLMFNATPLLILHDADLGGFNHGWRQAVGEDSWRVDQISGNDSLLASFCALSSGVIVHGNHYRSAAETACGGPVATIPLAFSSADVPPPKSFGDRIVLTTIGHINSNKRADETLRAIGASARLRDRVLYLLVGPVDEAERQRLLSVARHAGARPPHFTGWVPEELVSMIMAGTDVACCLRYPALEGGSASLIVSLLSARPTLVSSHASYADVPDDLVLKCPPGAEATAVMRHLEDILDNPEAALAMGKRAREYARRQHSPSSYVDHLLPILAAATCARPAVRTALSIGRTLGGLGVTSGDEAIERLEAARASLLGEPSSDVETNRNQREPASNE